jgi:hypothetical protein
VTAPIFFNRPAARAQLMRTGRAYTLRRRRSVGIARAREGSYHRFRDLGLVHVSEVAPRPAPESLSAFLHLSGYSSVAEWESDAAPGADYVYFVEMVPVDPEDG